MGEIERAVQTSIEAGISAGTIDRKLHAAAIASMLTIARTIDLPTFPMVGDDRYDNVSIPTLLRYLQAMGLTVAEVKPARSKKASEPKKSKLDEARERRLHVV